MEWEPFDFQNENYHLGHMFLDAMRSWPDAICQLDAATGESETNASVLSRSIQLARCFRNFGLKPGDILALGGRNHLDLHIPYYAALLNGITIAGVDPNYKYYEIRHLFKLCSPSIVFCQKEVLEENFKAVKELGLDSKIICFDEGEQSMAKFIEQYDDEAIEEFFPATFDLNNIYAWLISTAGTTGNATKLAAFKHKIFISKMETLKALFPRPQESKPKQNLPGLHLLPIHWISGLISPISMPLVHQTSIQTSATPTISRIIDIINQYKPITSFMNPWLASAIFRSEKDCDFTCFDRIDVAGEKMHKDIYTELRKRMRPDAVITVLYGQTENLGRVLMGDPNGPIGNCGKESPHLFTVKLVDTETSREIIEPNVPGELWTKGALFSEYYNNPEETAAAFSEDGWFKTGDILYRDENGYFFFVERLKMLIKYRDYHIIPLDIEAVIREHPDVINVSVTGVPAVDGEHVVACIETTPESKVTAEEIKQLVANKLSDSQRLRGGVVFMDLPLTSTWKVARGKLRQLVLTAHRE